jgi:serine/threonine protein kinase
VCVRRDVYGAPEFRAGNNAAIFRYTATGGEGRFLKCHIRPNHHLRALYRYIECERPPLLPEVRLLAEEMFVHTLGGEAGWADVVEGVWTPGETLAAAVARAVRTEDGGRLTRLADAFDALMDELSAAQWAHGDLKPENIIVREETGGGSGPPPVQPHPLPALVLIDCDAMWIPALAGERAVELGTPPYRDPARTPLDFDKTIDHHPARLIAEGLRTLALRPELWPHYTTFEELIMDN